MNGQILKHFPFSLHQILNLKERQKTNQHYFQVLITNLTNLMNFVEEVQRGGGQNSFVLFPQTLLDPPSSLESPRSISLI